MVSNVVVSESGALQIDWDCTVDVDDFRVVISGNGGEASDDNTGDGTVRSFGSATSCNAGGDSITATVYAIIGGIEVSNATSAPYTCS